MIEIPVNDPENNVYYGDNVYDLPGLLADGKFAEPVIADVIPESIYISLFSAAITNLWEKEHAVVIKVHPDEVRIETPPCKSSKFFEGNSWCDEKGQAFILLKYPDRSYGAPSHSDVLHAMKNLPGIDKLEDYHMDIGTVVRATEVAANKNGGKPYHKWDPKNTLDHMLESEDNMKEFVTFNFPFCDLTHDAQPERDPPHDICDDEVNNPPLPSTKKKEREQKKSIN